MERVTWKQTLSYVKQIDSGVCSVTQGTQTGLCNNLEGWDRPGGGREVQEAGVQVYIWLIHIDVWQKPTQYCKAIILQLKINN